MSCRLVFKLKFKSRDFDSSSQVQGLPCGQELAKVGPETHGMMGMRAQGQPGAVWPIRDRDPARLANEGRVGGWLAVSTCHTTVQPGLSGLPRSTVARHSSLSSLYATQRHLHLNWSIIPYCSVVFYLVLYSKHNLKCWIYMVYYLCLCV